MKQTWNSLLGYETIRQSYLKLLNSQNDPSVLLLHGKEGIGKSSFAIMLSALHLCFSQKACGTCEACRELLGNQHPDVIVIDTEETLIKRKDIMKFHEHLSYKSPQSSAKKIYRFGVILDCERLTYTSSNYLLKLLEEPPEGSKIILTTSYVHRLLPTLRSRCFHWALPSPKPDELTEWFNNFCKNKPSYSLTDEKRDKIMQQARYSPGLLLSILSENKPLEKKYRYLSKIILTKHHDISTLLINIQQTLEKSKLFVMKDFLNIFETELRDVLYGLIGSPQCGELIQKLNLVRDFLSTIRRQPTQISSCLNSQLILEKIAIIINSSPTTCKQPTNS